MPTALYLIDHHEAEVAAAVRRMLVEHVAPVLKNAIEEGARRVAAEFDATADPFANYAAQELLLEGLASLLTLSDVSELEIMQPPMLGADYVRAWFNGVGVGASNE